MDRGTTLVGALRPHSAAATCCCWWGRALVTAGTPADLIEGRAFASVATARRARRAAGATGWVRRRPADRACTILDSLCARPARTIPRQRRWRRIRLRAV